MKKAELRRQFLAERKLLSANEVEFSSQLIAEHFFDFLEQTGLADSSGIIHTFLPIQRQNEVDTWPIIHTLWARFGPLSVAVSVTDSISHTLSHYWLTPETTLTENHWGIPEPTTAGKQILASTEFKIVLVPLLAFDLRGHRVGYGGGFYDRFLAECRPDCLKIGLSLVEPIDRIEAIEPTDIPLDACITPTQIRLFS